MTQQTDRLAAVAELKEARHSEGDPIYSGAILSSDGLHIVLSKETVDACIEALSQPAAHPEPDNAGALEALKHLWDEIDAPKHGYEYARSLYDTVTSALAKPAVPDISLPDGWDIYCLGRANDGYWLEIRHVESGKLCRDMGLNVVYANTIAEVFSKAREMVAYLKLSGQKEGEE